MRVLLSVCVFVLLFGFISAVAVSDLKLQLSDSTYEHEFTAFTVKHNKQYKDVDEYFNRYNIFKSNLDYINKHNAEAADGKHTFTVAVNQFADMTNKEYRYLLKARSKPIRNSQHCRGEHVASDNAVPTSWDWRPHVSNST